MTPRLQRTVHYGAGLAVRDYPGATAYQVNACPLEPRAVKQGDEMDTFNYMTEAEPRLLKLRKKIESGMVPRAALEEIHALLGLARFEKDYEEVQSERPKPADREPWMWRLNVWQEKYPRDHKIHRLYGKAAPWMVARDLGLLDAATLKWFENDNGWRAYVSNGYSTEPKKAA